MRLTLHLGLPRTATTALQAHVFPSLQSVQWLGKIAYQMPRGQKVKPLDIVTAAAEQNWPALQHQLPVWIGILIRHERDATANPSGQELMRIWNQRLLSTLHQSLVFSGCQRALFSHEALINTEAARNAITSSDERSPALLPLLQDLKTAGWGDVDCVVVYREPRAHCLSVYKRCCLQRQRLGLRWLNPGEWLAKQRLLLQRHPPSSALFQLLHREHLAWLNRHLPTKPVGYLSLISSSDCEALLGFEAEREKPKPFPDIRENRITLPIPDSVLLAKLEAELTQCNLGAALERSQLFE